MRKLLIAAALALLPVCANAQSGAQVGAGQVWGNSTATRAPGKSETVTAILDRALGSMRGAITERGAGGWGIIGPGATAGLALITGGAGADPAYGVLGLSGGGCNAVLTASNGGILYSTASACAILAGTANASRPLLSGANSAPSWGAFSLPASVTSGGVAYFSSTSSMASSGLLTANALMVGGGAGVGPTVLGSLGTTTTVLHGNAGGAPSFSSVVSADLNITPTSCTNQFVSAISATAVATCTAFSLSGAQFANQGSTTTVLHGNAGGNLGFSAVAYADISSTDIASVAQYLAGTSSKLVQSGVIYAAEVSLGNSGTGTLSIDFSTFINASVTMTGNISTQTLTNVTAGKSGAISFIQDGTGSRTMVWNSTLKFTGGLAPVLTTTPAAVDVLVYHCRSATFCAASLMKDVK